MSAAVPARFVPAERVEALERAAARAVPARRRAFDDGWWLRSDDGGVVGRANSVWPAARGDDALARKVDRVEAWYQARGRPARFQLGPAAVTMGLVEALQDRAYRLEGPVAVLERALVGVDADAGPGVAAARRAVGHEGGGAGVRLAAAPDEAWRAAYASTLPAGEVPARTRLAGAAPAPRAYASIDAVACGLAVLDGADVGLFDLATAPAARRRGHASRIAAALLGWAWGAGATRAYLQVAEANLVARAWYERDGFRPAYRYVYAVAPGAAAR